MIRIYERPGNLFTWLTHVSTCSRPALFLVTWNTTKKLFRKKEERTVSFHFVFTVTHQVFDELQGCCQTGTSSRAQRHHN